MNRTGCVVVLIFSGTLLGLIIKGVSEVRHRAAVTACTNNLKQLGLALHNYHNSNKKFPLAIAKYILGPHPQTRVADLPIGKSASWLFELHPYVEARMDPRFKMNIDTPWDAEENQYVADNDYPVAQCPGNTAADKTMNSYIGILGLGRDAGWQPTDDKARGVFGFGHHVTIADIKDGTSNTMALAETVHENGRWIAGGYPTARGLDPQGPPYLGRNGQFGSFHPHVCIIGMADASVRELNDKLSPGVLEALATIAASEPIDPLELN